MKLQYVSRKHVSHVQLQKDGRSSVGIDIKGAECEQGPTIKSIKNKSLAHRSQCVSEGDVILSVCGQDSRGMSRKDVKQLMKEAKFRIDLKLQYEIAEPCLNSFRINRLQRMALKLRREQDSFGFILRKNGLDHNVCSEYPIVSNIRRGGPADKAGSLKAGDHLVQIDDQSLSYLSLTDISNILKEKEKAIFLFQYNIAVVDSYIRPEERNELEVDCVGADLGVTLTSSIENSSEIFIKEVQTGSLAERCGALQVGDVLVRIGDIDTVFLTPSKANSLLQGFKKNPGKIVFIPKTKRSPLGRVPERNSLKDQTPSLCGSTAEDQLVPLKKSSPKLHNSPESLYQTFHAKRTSPTPKCDYHAYDLQIKTVAMLRDVIENISNLKHFIPFLDCYENHNSFGDPSDKADSSSKDNLIQFHPSRVSQLTAAYVRTKDSAYAATMYIIKNAMAFSSVDADDSHNSSNVSCRGDGNKCHVRSNLLQRLTENLTEIYTKQFMSKYYFDRLVENLNEIDLDCWECSELCVLAAMTTQNVTLLLSLHDSNPNVWPIIKKLMDGIIKLKIPCEECQKDWCSISQLDRLVSSNGSNKSFNQLRNQPLVTEERICNSRQSGYIVEDASKQFQQRKTKSPQVGLNIAEETAAYSSSTPIQSESNSSGDDNPSTYSHFQRIRTNMPVTSPSSFESKQVNEYSVEDENGGHVENYNRDSSTDKFQKGKDFPPATKHNWKSAEVISDSRNSPSVIPKHASVPSNIDENYQFVSRQSPLGVSSSSSGGVMANQGCIVHPGNPSTSKDHSFSSEPRTLVTTIDVPTKSSTLKVTLKDGGRGYGIDIGFESRESGKASELPVVKAVIPQCAADKMGVLVAGDRVLEINGQRTVSLTPTELECLTLEAFHANEMQLLTEFDLELHEVKYGTFDIFVDSSAKAGLVFVDFRQETPLVVKGVVKGSAAHRCGQLFAGDEILYTNCLREEVYNSFKNTFRKKNTLIITIRRTLADENSEISQECDVQPRQSPSLADGDKMYDVKRISTRVENGTMILEHELTLFRDLIQKDFGFLVSTNLKSGRVYVDFIRPEGPADMCKVIKKNDRVLQVNGKAILVNDENSILSTFLQMEDKMDLITRRILRCQ